MQLVECRRADSKCVKISVQGIIVLFISGQASSLPGVDYLGVGGLDVIHV